MSSVEVYHKSGVIGETFSRSAVLGFYPST